MIKFKGFAPDLDINDGGVLLDKVPSSFIPNLNGIGSVKSLVPIGYPALSNINSGVIAKLIDNTNRFFVGTATKIYEGSNNLYTEVGNYTGSTEAIWRFAQFGNQTLATNGTDPVQSSIFSGNFSNLGGSPPKAFLIEICKNFVFLFNYNDGTNEYGDGWWCSGIGNSATWTPSIATQAANGRLLEASGKITAVKTLGDNIVVYKDNSIFIGTYQGSPVIWSWQLVVGDIGCVSQESLQAVIINDAVVHIFCSGDGFYIFDGTRPRFIGEPLKNWFNNIVPSQYKYKIKSLHNKLEQIIIFYLPNSNGDLTYAVVYNYRSNIWGYLNPINKILCCADFINSGFTYNSLGSGYLKYDDLPLIPYNSPFWINNSPIPCIVESDNIVKSYSGVSGASSFTTGFSGDFNNFSLLSRVRPAFKVYPTSATLVVNYTQNLGSTTSLTPVSNLNNNKFDVLKSSKFFSMTFNLTGNFEMTGYEPLLQMESVE